MPSERENPDTPPLGRRDPFDVPRPFPLRRIFTIFFGNGGRFGLTAIQKEMEERRQQFIKELAKKHNPDLEKELLRIEDNLFSDH